jgi:hypothetical protein
MTIELITNTSKEQVKAEVFYESQRVFEFNSLSMTDVSKADVEIIVKNKYINIIPRESGFKAKIGNSIYQILSVQPYEKYGQRATILIGRRS